MKAIQVQVVIATCLAAALMSGCANTNPRSEASPSYPSAYSSSYGVIEAIETTRASGDGIGVGTVIGGVIGGVLGSQVGSGSGKTAATVAGAAGGAVVGHEIEKRNQTQDAYHIRVRLDNGSYQTVTQDSINDLQVGNRVRVENNRVSRYYGNDRGYRYDDRGTRY
ncbi:MAG TPA: glycine zipper 2TM domain-containing protein [Gammaproteobacteria bacterium]|nr:glycine zipper 2TM domain-containing protein [Gammaproteobacteria bacterium]